MNAPIEKRSSIYYSLPGSSVICILLTFFSCTTRPEIISHPDYFDPILQRADSINFFNHDKALDYVDSAYNASKEVGIKDLLNKYNYIVRIYESQNKHEIAALYADSMLWVIRDHISEDRFSNDYSKALYAKGAILEHTGNYSKALEYNYMARKAFEKFNNNCGLSEFTSMLAFIKHKQKKELEAARFGVQAYTEALYCPDKHEKLTTLQGKLDNIGIYYTCANMPDSGLYYFNEALKNIGESKIKLPGSTQRYFEMATAVIYGNMGDALYLKGDTAKAEQLYQQSINTNIQQGFDKQDALLTMAKLAKLYLIKNQLPLAQKTLARLRTYLDSIPNRAIELKWYGLQNEYYATSGHKEIAYGYLQLYAKLKDSLATSQPLIDVDKESERIRNHYDVIALGRKNELKDLFLIITLIAAFLAIAIAVLLWLYWNRSKKLNKQIAKQNSEMQLVVRSLEETQKENTRMMKIVAHDLRNPITSVISITSIILESENLSADDREMLLLMQTSSQNSVEMIADLLNVNTTAEGMIKEPVEVHTLLQYCVNMLQYKASEKQQRIIFEEEPATLNINRDKMWRVFSNLIANAIKFSPEKATISVNMVLQKDNLRISVQDHGIGIPDDIKDKVFDMFGDAKRPGTSGEQSFGLGLSISRQIVEAHHGKIWFESVPGKGSTFIVSLPLNH